MTMVEYESQFVIRENLHVIYCLYVLTPNPMGWVCTFNIVYYLILGNKEGQESLGEESQ